MPYSPKKGPQRGSVGPGSPPARPTRPSFFGGGSGSIDRGLMRPEWKAHLEKRAAERAAVERRPGAPMPARPGAPSPVQPEKLTRRRLKKDPFLIWAPTPEEIEAERQEGRRTSRLHEVMIPEAEQDYIRSQTEAFRRGEQPSFERRHPTSSPLSPYGRSRFGTRPEQPPPVPQGPAAITPEYLAGVFDLGKMWDHVRQMRQDPKFKAQKTGGIGIIAPAGIDPWGKVMKAAEFFGIPQADIAKVPREQAWDSYMKPFLAEVERVLAGLKPGDFPGRFHFETSPSGAFGLAYTEK